MAQGFWDFALKGQDRRHVVGVVGAKVLVEHVDGAAPVGGGENGLWAEIVGVRKVGPESFNGVR